MQHTKIRRLRRFARASQKDADNTLPKMAALRVAADEAETLTDSNFWPFPTYGNLLFGVK